MSILYYYFNAVIKIKYIAKSQELTFPWDLEKFIPKTTLPEIELFWDYKSTQILSNWFRGLRPAKDPRSCKEFDYYALFYIYGPLYY